VTGHNNNGARADSTPALELRNEFARVGIAVDTRANGPRLMIVDRRSGQTAYFDPLELEQLAWTRHSELTSFLDPARRADGEPTGGGSDHDE
jgi:hypothetical protein